MNKLQRQALKDLGIKMEKYYVEDHDPEMEGLTRIWGTEFLSNHGDTLFVIEHTPKDLGDGLYHVRRTRSTWPNVQPSMATNRLQRLAIADALRMML